MVTEQPRFKPSRLCHIAIWGALHYITLHYQHFKRHLHLKWPVVHQQLHVIRNTAHRPNTQASYTASQVRPKRKISCAAAQFAATLTISFPRWRHMSLTSYWGQQRMSLTSYPGLALQEKVCLRQKFITAQVGNNRGIEKSGERFIGRSINKCRWSLQKVADLSKEVTLNMITDLQKKKNYN